MGNGKPIHLRMREYRENRGMSETYVAQKTGKTIRRISALETGKIRLTADEFEEICKKGYQVSPAIFFTQEGSENEN
jgi:transcriptional regulator with XRE-family HTH domain